MWCLKCKLELGKAIKIEPKNTGYYPLKEQTSATRDTDCTFWNDFKTHSIKTHYDDTFNIYAYFVTCCNLACNILCVQNKLLYYNFLDPSLSIV